MRHITGRDERRTDAKTSRDKIGRRGRFGRFAANVGAGG
jgi:hypothetical protein